MDNTRATPQRTGDHSATSSRALVRRVPVAVAFAAIAFVLVWVLFLMPETDQQLGAAIHDPSSFVITLLNALTFSGLLFIAASGFSLIFGLMRTVNMAHGSLLLLGGYVAYDLQQSMTNGGDLYVDPSNINTLEWIVPAIVAMAVIAAIGLGMQQILLRWNQGQDLRQALITVAVSVIVADQIIAHFHEGQARSLQWPGWLARANTTGLVDIHVAGVQYSVVRFAVLALGLSVGLVLWLWLYRTRTGMVIRAGVDDRQMASALGVNIQVTFAIAFAVGAALAAFGGVVYTSQAGASTGVDGQWLLYSLVVVIIGGMGSIFGAAAGALLYGLVFSFAAVYLPTTSNECCTQYSIVLSFALLAIVLAFRPQGLFGRPG